MQPLHAAVDNLRKRWLSDPTFIWGLSHGDPVEEGKFLFINIKFKASIKMGSYLTNLALVVVCIISRAGNSVVRFSQPGG